MISEGAARFYHEFIAEIVLNPWFYGVVAVVYGLESIIPGRRQPFLGRGTVTDLIWVPFYLACVSVVLPAYLTFLHVFYVSHFDFLTINAFNDWPWTVRVIVALLVQDFLVYVTHVVRHRVKPFWRFHAVHHSQKDISFFTNYRVHPLDDVILYTIGFIPYFAIVPSPVSIALIVWLQNWHTQISHSNIRTNFGPLKYILVSPQSHRIHHSAEAKHQNRNFARTFCIWDQLFGTQYWDFNDYPITGIDDEAFPFEQQQQGWFGSVNAFFLQLVYPFGRIAADLSAWRLALGRSSGGAERKEPLGSSEQ
jgi:sterol desaturase/sphingolipid hydroxylase (fatty acid hydroxylase superfamily)